MVHNAIRLREDDPNVTLTPYTVGLNLHGRRDAMLVIPGGGYSEICDDREGEPIASYYSAKGINSFVLRYSVRERAKYPRPLVDASLAMAYIKAHADEYNIDPDRIFVVGFSAGGHLAAALGTMWHSPEANEGSLFPYGANKPAGMVLCYPVISGVYHPHLGSFYNLLGTQNPTEEELEKYSLELRVDEKTCPAFIMHTRKDEIVPVWNSIRMAEKLTEHDIPFELHLYAEGRHGLALANNMTALDESWFNPRAAEWIDNSIKWMQTV